MRRILISADLEGIAGVVASEELRPGNAEYERARVFMTDEVNAAVRGVEETDGSIDIVVADSHGTYRNILQDRLHQSAMLLRGRPRTLAMIEAVDRVDAVVFVGYHGRASQFGLLTHTFNDTVRDIRCNGRSLGEAGLNAAVASHFDAPLLVATGDDALAAEVRELTEAVSTVVVKRWVSALAAESMHPTRACDLIQEAVTAAVTRWEGGYVRFEGSVDAEIDLATPVQADRAALPPPVTRVGPCTVAVTSTDIVDAYRWIRTVSTLASHPA